MIGPRHNKQIIEIIALFSINTLLLSACVTSTSHDRLTRKHELTLLELENKEHTEKGLRDDLAAAQLRISDLERRLAEFGQTLDDKSKTIQDLEQANAKEQQTQETCRNNEIAYKTVLDDFREALASGRITRKDVRNKFLQTLNGLPRTVSALGPKEKTSH